ncbi:MAG: hypothetical protein ACREOU_13030 [Candidatus Eiseniibacteriota bacterium]
MLVWTWILIFLLLVLIAYVAYLLVIRYAPWTGWTLLTLAVLVAMDQDPSLGRRPGDSPLPRLGDRRIELVRGALEADDLVLADSLYQGLVEELEAEQNPDSHLTQAAFREWCQVMEHRRAGSDVEAGYQRWLIRNQTGADGLQKAAAQTLLEWAAWRQQRK